MARDLGSPSEDRRGMQTAGSGSGAVELLSGEESGRGASSCGVRCGWDLADWDVWRRQGARVVPWAGPAVAAFVG